MDPGYSRERAAARRKVAVARAAWLLSLAAAAQQPEVQFLRAWQPAERGMFSELSGFALAADGSALIADRDRGVLWRVTADTATATELAGERPCVQLEEDRGLAARRGRVAVANTRNDRRDRRRQGRAERVFAGSGTGYGELNDPEGLAFSAAAASLRRRPQQQSGRRLFRGRRVPACHRRRSRSGNGAGSSRPQVAVDAAERVFVLEDSGPGRLSVYGHTGQLIKRLAAESFAGSRSARWRALAADPSGRVFISDGANGNIIELDWEHGQVCAALAAPGEAAASSPKWLRLRSTAAILRSPTSAIARSSSSGVPEPAVALRKSSGSPACGARARSASNANARLRARRRRPPVPAERQGEPARFHGQAEVRRSPGRSTGRGPRRSTPATSPSPTATASRFSAHDGSSALRSAAEARATASSTRSAACTLPTTSTSPTPTIAACRCLRATESS